MKKYLLVAILTLGLLILGPLYVAHAQEVDSQGRDAQRPDSTPDITAAPTADIDISPLPSVDPSLQPDRGTPNANGNLKQINSAILTLQQQIQSQMTSCVQKKNQLFDIVVSQDKKLKQLEKQRDSLSDQLSRAQSDRQIDSINDQIDALDDKIDDANDALSDAEESLDDAISDCQEAISKLESRIDDLESKRDEAFNELLEFEIPD